MSVSPRLQPEEVTLGLRAVRAAARGDSVELLGVLREIGFGGLSPAAVLLSIAEYAGRVTAARPGWEVELDMAITAAEIDELDTPSEPRA